MKVTKLLIFTQVIMNYLTYEERKKIEKMKAEGLGPRPIGKVLGRGHSTISEELSRTPRGQPYQAENAHARFLSAQERKGKTKILYRCPELKALIIKWTSKDQWSPEQIAGILKLIHNKTMISHETIYQFLYSDEGKALRLWTHLRRKHHPRRQHRAGRKSRTKEIIPDRTPIQARGKKGFGDLESDSMIFSQQRAILSVQVESMSQRCALTRLPNKTATETNYAIIKAIEELGEAHITSITFDNGTENAKHTQLKDEYGIETYFCDPYCSWQKGKVENLNGLIRQYLPRTVNMKEMTDEQIFEIQEKLNNRPRKSLGYFTPNHAFQILAQGGRLRT